MNKKIRTIYSMIIIVLLLVIYGCNDKSVNIKIIQTSDVHGSIFPFDIVDQKNIPGSLSRVKSYVESQRKTEGQNVILIDNGDILQGDPMVYYFNYLNPDRVNVVASVMNFMRYDAGTVGNHDIEAGHAVYDRFYSEIEFPWLAANAIKKSTGDPYFKPYTIIERRGVRIAILGLITPAIPQWLHPDLYKGIEFKDMVESAKKWMIVIEEDNPDIIIGLFHSGVDFNYNNQSDTTYCNENASKLVAELVPGFDAVLVGHDHHGWNEYVVNISGDSVLIAGPTSQATDVVSVDFNLVKGKSGYKIKTLKCNIVDMNEYNPDPEFVNLFRDEFEEVNKYFSERIGSFTSQVVSTDALFGNSKFVDFIHNIQLENSEADISFSASMAFNDTIYKGDFRSADLFKIYKYDNTLYTLKLTGKEIKDYLEYSYSNWFATMQSKKDHLLKFMVDSTGSIVINEKTNRPFLEGRYYNFDCAAGINYDVNISKKPGSRIVIHSLCDGKKFYSDSTYLVCMNSYRGNGGGGHLSTGAGIPASEIAERIVKVSEHDMRWYILKWFEDKEVIIPKANENWKVIPENFYKAGKERDFGLLFNND